MKLWWLVAVTLLLCISGRPSPPCSVEHAICRGTGTLLPDTTLNLTEVVWIGPESHHVYVGSPSITQLPSGRWLASHDFFFHGPEPPGHVPRPPPVPHPLQATAQVFESVDDGQTWRYLSNTSDMFWGNLFVHNGVVYLMGVSAAQVVITSGGATGAVWTDPVVIFPVSKTGATYITGPTPTLLHDGVLYRAMETRNHPRKGYNAVMLSVPATANLLDPKSWSISPTMFFNHSWIPTSWGNHGNWTLIEGNAVSGPDGHVWDIFRLNGQNTQGYNKAMVARLDTDGVLRFVQVIDFPSTYSKFTVRRDPHSGVYYTLTTNVTEENVKHDLIFARNNLVLATSVDLLHWRICKRELWDDTGMTVVDSAWYTGFHYVDWAFHGADMMYVIRTAYRGADSYHNSNRLTFKRLTNYASACAA